MKISAPNVDYYIAWSLGQKQSIKGIADGTYEAAAVSDDKLHSLLDRGTITEASYHVIYQSDVFPRTAIGYFYNLKPDLAAKVSQGVLSYKPVSTDADDKPMHFTPVDYKKDFALVRSIDDRFDPRMEPKAKHPDATTEPSALGKLIPTLSGAVPRAVEGSSLGRIEPLIFQVIKQ